MICICEPFHLQQLNFLAFVYVLPQDLLRSELPDAIEKALQGDERCILDTMRLVDLLLVLLFEGRQALPKSCVSIPRGGGPGIRRFDSSNERSHRQLIDCIRSKDTDALIDAIENGKTIGYFYQSKSILIKVHTWLVLNWLLTELGGGGGAGQECIWFKVTIAQKKTVQ